MKIAIFSEAYLSQTCGVATHVSILAKGLTKLGHDVLIVTSDLESDECCLDENVLLCPARLSDNSYGRSAKKRKTIQISRYVDEFNPDVIHIETISEMGAAGLRYARTRDLPLVTTIHHLQDIDSNFESSYPLDKINKVQNKSLVTKVLDASDVITGTSKKMAEKLKSSGRDRKVKQIPFCIDTALFQPQGIDREELKKARNRMNLGADKTGVLFVGRISNDNNLESLIDQWAKVISPKDKLHLAIVGSGKRLKELAEKVKLLGISHQVTFTGTIPHDEIKACYCACQAFVSASVSPTMKAAPIEAIACGLPVIVQEESANADILSDGVNGFTYDQPEKLAELLKKLAKLDQDGKNLMQKLVSRTATNLTAENQAKALVEYYSLAKKHHYKRVEKPSTING